MGEKSQFNMVIPVGQKNRWEKYVEENPDLLSISQLVRQAVEAEIRQNTSSDTADVLDERTSSNLSEVLENTQTIQAQIGNIEDWLYSIEKEVRDNPEISELAVNLFEILPTQDDVEAYHTGPSVSPEQFGAGTVESPAAGLGEDEYRVQKALEKLQSELALVYSTDEYGDDVVYYESE